MYSECVIGVPAGTKHDKGCAVWLIIVYICSSTTAMIVIESPDIVISNRCGA